MPKPGERKPGEHSFDAKHWDEILEYNGWRRCMSEEEWPTQYHKENGIHFIGVIPNEGEFGQIVWFEGIDFKWMAVDGTLPAAWRVSTYRDFERKDYYIPASKDSGVIWFREQ